MNVLNYIMVTVWCIEKSDLFIKNVQSNMATQHHFLYMYIRVENHWLNCLPMRNTFYNVRSSFQIFFNNNKINLLIYVCIYFLESVVTRWPVSNGYLADRKQVAVTFDHKRTIGCFNL